MVKNNFMGMLVAILIFAAVFSGCGTNVTTVAQTDGRQATPVTENSIHGAWEMQTDNSLHVTYFSDGGIFIAYRDGIRLMDGSYSIKNAPNQPQKITFEWSEPLGLDSIEFEIRVTANELIIDGEYPNRPFLPTLRVVEPGRHRRSSFVLEVEGNPLVGVWKSQSQIFRFYRNGQGLLTNYQNEPEFAEEWLYRFSYEFSNQSRSGRLSLLNWQWNVDTTYPFTVNDNVLRIEGVTSEYIRQ